MKKKIFVLLFVSIITFGLIGCEKNTEGEPKSEQKTEKKLPDGNYEDKGAGTMYIATASGTSENGNVPVLFASDEEILVQIELNTFDFDGSKLSYIYIDGMLDTKEQLGDSQIPLDLSKEALSAGKHKVEVVQYENDDETEDMVTYKQAAYAIKKK